MKIVSYNVHFGSVSGEERSQQANCVLGLVRKSPSRGGAWSGPKEYALLDYCLVSKELRASASWIDETAAGWDHQPLWVEFEAG